MKERNPLSAAQQNLEKFLTRLPGTQPLSTDQKTTAPIAPLKRQQENPNYLSLQNQPPEDK